MVIEIINKLLMILLMLSSLTTLRHSYYFIQAYITSTEELPVKYILSPKTLLFLGLSVAYILTVIFTGIKI